MDAPPDLEVRPGESLPLRLVVSTDGAGDLVTSLDGWAVRILVKETLEQEDAAAVIARSTAAGTIALLGNTALTDLTATDTALLSPARQFYYVAAKVRDPAGREKVLTVCRLLVPAPGVAGSASA